MASVIEAQPSTEAPPGEQRFLLTGVSWETYCAMVEDSGFFHVRMTYDQGALELMSPSPHHEYYAHLLGRMVEAYTEEAGIRIRGSRSTTLRRALLKRGLEADESYYVQHEAEVRGKREWDFDVDPPPDLAIEVEVTNSMLNKIDVYQALKVPEVWRFNGTTLTVLVLNSDGDYEPQQSSVALPQLPLNSLVEWVNRGEAADDAAEPIDENSLIRQFREWIRNHLISNDED